MDESNMEIWQQNSRFKNLLNFPRDSVPWAVDIANQLIEYGQSIGLSVSDISELPEETRNTETDSLDSSTDNEIDAASSSSSPISVDFAQAALILQGSTTIYSRKIDKLYTIVYEVCDKFSMINGQKEKSTEDIAGDGNRRNRRGNKDAANGKDDTFNIDDIDLMSSLDNDFDSTDDNDDHDDDDEQHQQQPSQSQSQQLTQTQASQRTQNGDSINEQSNEDPTRIRPIPSMLKQNVNIGIPGVNIDRANYKIRSALIHSSGALITDGCPPVDENLDITPTRPFFPTSEPPTSQMNQSTYNDDDDLAPPENFDDYDDQHESENPTDQYQPPLISQTLESDPVLDDTDTHSNITRHSLVADRNNTARPINAEVDDGSEEEREIDPFELFDPHEERASMDRPMRVAKTFRQPRVPTKSMINFGYSSPSTHTLFFASKDQSQADDKNLTSIIDNAIGRVPKNASLTSYVCVAAARDEVQTVVRRRKRLRTKSKKNGKKKRREHRFEEFGVNESNDRNRARDGIDEDGGGLFGEFGDDDDGGNDSDGDVQITRGAGDGLPENVGGAGAGGPMEGVFLFDDDDNGDFETLHGQQAYDASDDRLDQNEDGMRDVFDNVMMDCSNEAGRNDVVSKELAALASSYAETCQNYISKTAWMWEKRVVDSHLVKRVEDWTARIHPVLEREEERDDFDIQACGQLLIDRMKERKRDKGAFALIGLENDTMNMSEVVREQEKFQVCRLFLSALQVTNDGRIDVKGDNEVIVRDPELTLTSVESETSTIEGGNVVGVGTPLGRSKVRRKRNRVVTPVNERRRPLRVRLDVDAYA